MSFPFPVATIPDLPNNTTPPLSSLLEISNSNVSENTSIQQILDSAAVELQSNKGAVLGYAGLDAAQELLLTNFPSGTALQLLRRNAGNTALEFVDPPQISPLTTKGDLYTFDTDNQRLPVGSDGQLLSANSATSTGLEWIAAPVTGLVSLNGDTTAAQIMAAGTGLQIADVSNTHTYAIDSTVATLTGVQTLENKTIDAATNAITGIFGITGLATQVQILNMGNFTIQAVDTPVNGTDAANKSYVDNLVNGLSWKNPARLATTGDITLSGNQTIDGFLTVDDDRVLVKDQSDDTENGVYAANSGAWTRTADTDEGDELVNMSIYITAGTANEDTSWVQTTDPPITVGVTSIVYAQVGAGTGNPLTTKGDIFGYDTANARIPVGADGQVLTANSAVGLGVEYQTKEFTGTRTADIAMGGFDILNFGIIQSNATSNTSGAINLDNGEDIVWDSVNDPTISVDAFGGMSIKATGGLFYSNPGIQANFTLDANHGVPASGQVISRIDSADNNSVASQKVYSRIESKIFDPANGSEDGELILNVTEAGATNIPYILLNGSGAADITLLKPVDFSSQNATNMGTLNTHTIPGGTDTFALLATTQTLTNKTLGTGTVFSVIPTINDGIKFTFNPDATNAGLNVGAQGDPDPTSPVNGDIYYNSTNNKFRAYENSSWVDMIGAGGASPLTTKGDLFGYDTGDARIPVGANGLVLTANSAVALGVEWAAGGSGDVVGPGSSTDNAIARFNLATGKLIQNGVIVIDDVANMSEVRSVQFALFNTTPGPTVEYIQYASSSLRSNVQTGSSHSRYINNSVIETLNASALNLTNIDIIAGAAYLQLSEIADPGNPGATNGRIYIQDVGGRAHVFIQDDVGSVDIQAGGAQTPWTSDIEAATFDLNNLGNLNFSLTGATGLPAITEPYITYDDTIVPDTMRFNVPTANEYAFYFNGVEEFNWSPTEFNGHFNIMQSLGNIFQVTQSAVGLLQLGRSNELTGQNASDIRFNAGNTRYAEILVNMVSAVSGSEIGSIDFLIKNDNTTTMDSMLVLVGGATSTSARINLGAPLGTTLDMDSHLINNLNQIRSDVGPSLIALAGFIRMGNDQLLGWRNAADTNDDYISFNASNEFEIAIDGTTPDYTFSSTVFDLIGKNLEAVNFIQDNAQNEQIDFSQVASAINHIEITNAAIGNGPIIGSVGDDTNVDLNIVTKGIGIINLNNDVLAAGDIVMGDRFQGNKGPDVVSADAITLGDGNYFDITAANTINHMINTNWQNGSVVTLQFDAAATVTDAAGGATGAEQDFALAGAANFVASAGDTLTLVNDGTLWREVARSVN